MKKVFTAAALAVMLTGCGLTGSNKGTRTTNYTQDGRVGSVVEETAVGDPNTEYYGAVKEVANHTAQGIKAKADAIREAAATSENDSEDAKAWKSAFAAMAIANIQDRTAENLAAVHKATTGYDVANSAVGAIKDIAVVGLPVYGAVKAVKYLSNQVGDDTSVAVTGDGNQYTSSKTHITNDVVSTVSGDESHPTVTATPNGTAGSPTSTETVTEMAPEVAPASAGE